MVDLKKRKRAVNPEALLPQDPAEVDKMAADIGNKIKKIMDEAVKEANELLTPFQQSIKFHFQFVSKLDEEK
jgi:hypothetical protein